MYLTYSSSFIKFSYNRSSLLLYKLEDFTGNLSDR